MGPREHAKDMKAIDRLGVVGRDGSELGAWNQVLKLETLYQRHLLALANLVLIVKGLVAVAVSI